jgi:hypothetical protein
MVGYFCIFQKMAKESNRSLGKNSPNLVTLDTNGAVEISFGLDQIGCH